MAVRLSTPLLTTTPQQPQPVPLSVAQLLPLLLCLCCCVRLAAPLTDANWPQLRMHNVFNATGLDFEQDFLLRETIRVAVTRIESLLRVLDLNPGQTMRLNRSRSYCSMWLEENRCGQLNMTYMSTGEVCTSDSSFRIPQEFLTEVAIFNSSRVVVNAAGPGAEAGANFILFVTVQQSSGFCSAANPRQVSAATCSQQWMARRPLAGLLSVCPQLINSELTSRSGRLLQQILAGLVRMLGFSANLIADFQRHLGSSSSDAWEVQESNIFTRQYGLTFVRTPAVHSFAMRHFNCSMGLPLASGAGLDAWDPAFMFPSALSAAPISPGVSGLDEGSLALLEDSGWYTVNYSLADRFSWGHRAGCWFSVNCSTNEPTHPDWMFCSAAHQLPSPTLKPDHSHRSVGSCDLIAGTNCSTILPRDSELCNLTGNFRSLQLLSPSRNWTDCLSVACPPSADTSSANYVVTRNGIQVTCSSNTSTTRLTQVDFGDGVRLLCVHISLVCPRQSSVLDLLAGFSWSQRDVKNASITVSAISTAGSLAKSDETVSQPQGTLDVGIGSSASARSSPESIISTSASTSGASSGTSTTAPTVSVSSISTTPITQAQSVRQIPPMKKSQQTAPFNQNNPPTKFSIRFEKMDYFQLVNKDLVQEFKVSLRKALSDAFRISIDHISIIDVKPGSVIAIWENSDPSIDANSKLLLIKAKVNDGVIIVTVNGVEYLATSVEFYTGENDRSNFPLMEVVIGSVVGALLLIGFILVIALVTMKHKLNRPRMQVRPRSADTSPTSSSQTSRQCSAATSGIVQLAVLGSAGAAPSTRAVADVESTLDGGRRNIGGRGGRDRGAGVQRGTSAGSVGLQFSDSALYFEA